MATYGCSHRWFVCIIGVVVIVFGAALLAGLDDFEYIFEENYSNFAKLMLAAGCALVVSTLVEEYCYVQGNKFSVCLIFLLQLSFDILLLSAGIIACVNVANLGTLSHSEFRDNFVGKYNKQINYDYSISVDSIQHKFQCCGALGYDDWFNSTWGLKNPQSVPDSCCQEIHRNCGANYSSYNVTLFEQGCFVVADYVYAYLLTASCLCIILFLLVGMVSRRIFGAKKNLRRPVIG